MRRLFTTIHRSNLEKDCNTNNRTQKRYKTTRSQITTSNTHIRQLSHFQQGKNTITRTSTNDDTIFKEAWHSTDDDTINRHIDIPTVYLQLKTVRKNSVNNNTKITNTNIVNNPITFQSRSTTHSYNSNDTLIPNNNVQSSMTAHLSTTNGKTSTCKEPIRRSQRIATARNLNIVHICK